MNNENNFPLDVVQCCLLFPIQLPTGTLLPCSVLIFSMAKNLSDVENLVTDHLVLTVIPHLNRQADGRKYNKNRPKLRSIVARERRKRNGRNRLLQC